MLLEDGQGHRDHLIARSTDRHTYSAASASNDILHGLYADREVGVDASHFLVQFLF